jgi:hypothetical protein
MPISPNPSVAASVWKPARQRHRHADAGRHDAGRTDTGLDRQRRGRNEHAPPLQAMQHEFNTAIERLTGHSVVAFISGNLMDPARNGRAGRV